MQLSNQMPMTDALPVAWVAKLIQKMKVMYGAKFTQQWAGIDPVDLQNEWSEILAGYTGEELGRGLDACRTRTFVPTLPEFMVLCRPPMDHQVAFHEAIQGLVARRKGERGNWSHPAIFHAALKVGQHDMLSGNYHALRSRWDSALNDQVAAREWAPVPDALVALEAPARTEMSNAEAQRAMNRLGAGNVLDKSGRDHKAWAKGIIANPKDHCHAAVVMAQRAMGEL